jgi:hypothetical protein
LDRRFCRNLQPSPKPLPKLDVEGSNPFARSSVREVRITVAVAVPPTGPIVWVDGFGTIGRHVDGVCRVFVLGLSNDLRAGFVLGGLGE